MTNLSTLSTYASIQAAIDDAATIAGHTLELSAGTYNERVVITKGIILQGATSDASLYVVDGTGILGAGRGISIVASNVTIKDLTVQDFVDTDNFGIHSECENDNIAIENVVVDGCGATGIALNGGDVINLTDITSTNNTGNGLSITDCQNVVVNLELLRSR